MPLRDKLREKLQEKRDQQQPDVHAVHVRVRRDDHLVVTQPVHPLLDVQRALQQVELLVLVDHLLRQPIRVQRLPLQREHRLRVHVATRRQRTRRRVALHDEQRALLRPLVLRAQMRPTIAQLLVVQRGLLRPLTRQIANARQLLALALALLDLALQLVRRLRIAVQEIVELLSQKTGYKVAHARPARTHVRAAQLRLRLRLEHRLLHPDRHRRHDRLADVRRVEILFEKRPQRRHQRLAKRRQMRAAHRRVLAVHERVILLAVMPRVRDRHLDVLALQMDQRIQRLARQLLVQQIAQTVLRLVGLAVENQRQPAVQVGVVPEHLLDELGAKLELRAEERRVRRELHQRAVARARLRRDDLGLLGQFARREFHNLRLPLADRLRLVEGGQRVHRLLADAIQTDGFLKRLRVVFRARVDDRHAIHQLAQRDAAPVVAHPQRAVVQLDLDLLAEAHREFVDAVIDRLLEQHVDAVLRMGAIAQATDIHAGPQADVFERGEGFDRSFGVSVGHGSEERDKKVKSKGSEGYALRSLGEVGTNPSPEPASENPLSRL